MIDAKTAAKELVEKFKTSVDINSPVMIDWLSESDQWYETFKACAIIAVDEIIKVVPMYTGNLNPDWVYWQKIKEEIQKL